VTQAQMAIDTAKIIIRNRRADDFIESYTLPSKQDGPD